MKALVKKEMIEVAFLLSIPFLALSVIWLATAKLQDVLLSPQSEPMLGVVMTALFAGVLLGLWQFEVERRRGTGSYLLHRGTGARGLFGAKAVVGIVGALTLAIGPVVVLALAHTLFSPNGSIVQWGRVVELACLASCGVTAWAAAALAAQIRRNLAVDIVIALFTAGGVVLLGFAPTIMTAFAGVNGPAAYLGFQIVATGLLLRLGAAMFARPSDRDLAPAARHHGALLVLALVALLPLAGLLLSVAQSELRQSVLRDYPSIVQERTSGTIRAVSRGDVWSRLAGHVLYPGLFKVYQSSEHQEPDLDELFHPLYWPVERRPDLASVEVAGLQTRGFPSHWDRLALGGASNRFDSPRGWFWVQAFLDPDAGIVRHFAILGPGEFEAAQRLAPEHMPPSVPFAGSFGKPAGSGRFSSSTIVCQDFEDREALLVDPEDGTIWQLDPLNFGSPISEVRLPGGDRFIGVEPLFDRIRALQGRLSQTGSRCVRGEKGIYAWNGDRFEVFEPAPEDGAVTADAARALAKVRVVVTDTDPIAPAVDVRDAKDGTTLFSYRCAPVTAGERARSTILHAVALLESPLGNAISFAGMTRDAQLQPRHIGILTEPLFVGRSRTGLLLAGLALAGLCLVDVSRRQRRRGAHVGVRLGSAGLIAIFGAPAWLLLRCLEPRSIPQRQAEVEVEVGAARAPALLIQSV